MNMQLHSPCSWWIFNIYPLQDTPFKHNYILSHFFLTFSVKNIWLLINARAWTWLIHFLVNFFNYRKNSLFTWCYISKKKFFDKKSKNQSKEFLFLNKIIIQILPKIVVIQLHFSSSLPTFPFQKYFLLLDKFICQRTVKFGVT